MDDEMNALKAQAVEASAKAAYEAYFGNLIGCAEPAWHELSLEHQHRLIWAHKAGIEAYENKLWSKDMDAAPKDRPVDLLVKWENGTKREPDATWERVASENDDLYDWYLPRVGDYLSEFVNWRLVAWRLPPSFEGVEG